MKNSWLAVFIPKIEVLVPSFEKIAALRQQGVVIYRVKRCEEGLLVLIASRHQALVAQEKIVARHSIYVPLLRMVLPASLVVLVLFVSLDKLTINYEIKGNLTEDEVTILHQHLASHFYHVGPFAFLKTSERDIQEMIHDEYNEFVWSNVYKHGTDIVIDLYDIEGVDEALFETTGDTLYATRSGVVQDYVVDNCRVLVNQNQFVRKGDPLVTCYVEHPLTKELMALDDEPVGEVYAKTWYEVDVSAKKSYEAEVFTARSATQYHMHLGEMTLTLPLQKTTYESSESASKTLDPFFFLADSPLYFEKEKIYEKSVIIKENTYEDVRKNLTSYIKRAFFATEQEESFEISELIILSEEETDESFNFKCHLTVYENIAN